ncbi:mandelate racemase/muconate lactonizing enzyme family protein [Nocardioides sp. CFH 31398]|uniref:mandelate racemase/muconate lactonizing enzyme family protein n=1 Tax=Nocardioides sp. CFH 31398 TaxID=2919579 RepID=UPI001F05818D|nr:enolase C-terminal domain-like protein [Nocardioides sp. CFH 31398]MCH1866227.1 mandelate racemase [Nocardioides sp. CFH 31398]
MRIEEIAVFSHPLPVVGGTYRIASGEVDALDSTLVRLTADDGSVGWGETCPVGPTYQPHHALGARAALAELGPALLGADPTHLRGLHRTMDGALAGHRYAKAAVDVAAHDLVARARGVRVADLLGGPLVDSVPSYYATGVGEPDEVAEVAAAKVAAGYRRVQVKIGGRPVEVDVEVVRRVWGRLAGTGARLVVDGNRSLTTADVVRLSQQCRDVPLVLEQPCDSLAEIEAVRDRLAHPVLLDEAGTDLATAVRAAGRGAVDGFAMKVTRIGGLLPMATFRDVCEATSLPHAVDDAWGGDVIAAACVQLASTVSPRLLEGVWIAQPHIAEHLDPDHGPEVVDGRIALPDGPGLGVVPREDLLGVPVVVHG